MRRYPRSVVSGRLRRRLLVNAVVDPGEAALHLPPGLRPHVTSAGTVVGCCLLDIDRLRPTGVSGALAIAQRAAAHRISAEWETEEGESVVGVYVPERRTDSRAAVMAGGRWFPGVHRPAEVSLTDTSEGLAWSVRGGDFSVAVTVTVPAPANVDLTCDPIAGICIAAAVGVSPGHSGELEGARMEPATRAAREVMVDVIESSFIDSFASAEIAPAYLMEEVAVVWTPEPAPSTAGVATLS